MSLKHCVVISYDIIKTAYQDTTSEMLFLSLIYFYTVCLFFLFFQRIHEFFKNINYSISQY